MLSDHERKFLLTRRVGHLATADSRAIPHVLPVCFTISQGTLYITIDEKPKRVAGPALKRVRNIERNPMVAVVVDRYDEDWARLDWVMLRGRAEILRTRSTIARRSCYALGTASWRLNHCVSFGRRYPICFVADLQRALWSDATPALSPGRPRGVRRPAGYYGVVAAVSGWWRGRSSHRW